MAFSFEVLFFYEVLFYISIFYFIFKSAHTICSMELMGIFQYLREAHAHTHTHTWLGFNVLWGHSVMIFILYKLPLTEKSSAFYDFQKMNVE